MMVTTHHRIGVRIATCVVTEICVTLVGLENSVDRVRGGSQTFATDIAMIAFVRYKFNSCGRNF